MTGRRIWNMEKIINRKYYESMGALTLKKGRFVCIGQWADGHLAYSRVDEHNNIIEDEDGVYVQLRSAYGYLYMQRI